MGLPPAGRSISQRADDAIAAVRALFSSIGIPPSIADLGITAEQLPAIAELAMGSTRLIKNNPRELDLGLMRSLVESAFHGHPDTPATIAQ